MSRRSRRSIYLVILSAVLLTLGASGAHAQAWNSSSSSGPGFWNRGFEITPFGGSRFGGVIDLNSSSPTNVDNLGIRSGWDYGAMLDVDLFPHAQAEFMWDQQPTVLSQNYSGGGSSRVGEASLSTFQWSFLYEFLQPGAKFQPYAVGGVGFTSYNTNGIIDLGNQLAFNVGGGVKYFFTPHVGVRLEARYMPSRTTEGVGEYCDPLFGCYAAAIHNYASQGAANVGVIFRF
ncbi:MAG TPA: outer membrane beta-barrel protein [Candidatus Aquilonibacter sp.]|nr:outer membrane beta-barrel protein [Candidatus Aquilonibacter sp.]